MIAGKEFLPYGRQLVEEDDIAAVTEVLRGDWLTTGPMVTRYEEAFAARIGAGHAVACNSGTGGLHLATLALGLGEGDWAVVPSQTFLATANAVRYVGAEVAFADVDAETGLMTPETLTAALTALRKAHPKAKVKAVLPVHLKGIPVDLPAIAALAGREGMTVVDDAAHAVGSRYPEGSALREVGSGAHSAMTVFSSHPVKTMTTAEGGMVTTNDADLYRRLCRFRSHGMEQAPERWVDPDRGSDAGAPAPWYYELDELGYNYRLPDLNCALGLSQLAKLDRFLSRRAALVARYDRLLDPLRPRVLPPARPAGVEPGWHLYAVRIDFAALGIARSDLMRALRAAGIGTQVHYIPVHSQPYYRRRYGDRDLPGAERYYRQTLSLPLFPGMADQDVDRVVEILSGLLDR